jgi:hypothetical protein
VAARLAKPHGFFQPFDPILADTATAEDAVDLLCIQVEIGDHEAGILAQNAVRKFDVSAVWMVRRKYCHRFAACQLSP